MSDQVDLHVDLAGIRMENPLVLASGTAGYMLESDALPYRDSWGAITLKSVTEHPRPGNSAPRLWETASGMLNSIGLENVGIEALIEELIPNMPKGGPPVIASIAAETIAGFSRIAALLERAGRVAAIEVNLSCPNVEKGGLQFGHDPDAVFEATSGVVASCSVPVFSKLSAAVTSISELAVASAAAGASGLSLINTLPAMAIDPVTRRPRLGNVTGGLSGPAIKPVALKAVWDCFCETGLPIIGGGGVHDENDVIEFMLAGASAVSVGTSTFQDPGIVRGIVERLPGAVARCGAIKASSLTGALEVNDDR